MLEKRRIESSFGARLACALLLFLCAPVTAALAGLTYHVESSVGGRVVTTGVVSVEGKRSRIDVTRGDRLLLRDGAVVISDGANAIYLLDPSRRSYSLLSVEQLASGIRKLLGNSNVGSIRILNPRSTQRPLGAAGKLEGFEVQRYATETSYDVLLEVGGTATKIRVRSASQVWSTPQLSRDYASFLQERDLESGIPAVDALLQQQSRSTPGFPLKEVVSTTIDFGGRVTRITSIVRVDHIQRRTIAASAFEVPRGYRRVTR